METYLGEDPDTQEALEFLCLAEGGEVTHYEVLTAIAKDVKNKKFGTTVRAILKGRTRTFDYCAQSLRRVMLPLDSYDVVEFYKLNYLFHSFFYNPKNIVLRNRSTLKIHLM